MPKGHRRHCRRIGAQDARPKRHRNRVFHICQSVALGLGEPAFGADEDGPGLIFQIGQDFGRGGATGKGLVAEQEQAILWPIVQFLCQRHQIIDGRHEGSAALLRGLDGMGLQTVAADALGIGEVALHRADARGAHFGGFLDDEIGAGLLDRGKEEPKVGRIALRRALAATQQRPATFASFDHLGLPFAIKPVEQGHTFARAKPHHAEQVMRLVPRQWDRLPLPQSLAYIEPDFRVFLHEDTMTEAHPEGQVADAVEGNWVDHWAPAWTRPYLRLSRADRPIGTWLLLLPCWWGLGLAALAVGGFTLQHLWIGIGCAIGAFLMRGAGCTWNDITDRDIDGSVERTRSRPIPSGQVSVKQAVVWMAVQALLAFGILLTFHPLAVTLGIGSLLLVCIYPFAKRFTWWPQVFLGLAFNWGALLAWAAATGSLAWPAVALYLAGIAWTLFYDTIYAHQDREDDALIGVKSTARLFGENTAGWLKWFLVASVSLMAIAMIGALAPSANALRMVLALGGAWAFGWHLAWQLRNLDIDDPERCMAQFRSNRDAGLIPVLFLAIALFL